eukprot:4515780-Prymnesium_polylepis.1
MLCPRPFVCYCIPAPAEELAVCDDVALHAIKPYLELELLGACSSDCRSAGESCCGRGKSKTAP